MQSRDITWEACKYLDDRELEKIYICGIVPELAPVLSDDLFWNESCPSNQMRVGDTSIVASPGSSTVIRL